MRIFGGNKKERRISNNFEEDKIEALNREKEISEDRSYFSRIILLDSILDRIEEEVDRRGGIEGMDGRTFADILSFYIEGDPRYSIIVQRELIRRKLRK